MRARRGFTLLEVLVAVAILGLGLTVILNSQTSSFSGAQTAQAPQRRGHSRAAR